jgi:hypothetical protein
VDGEELSADDRVEAARLLNLLTADITTTIRSRLIVSELEKGLRADGSDTKAP